MTLEALLMLSLIHVAAVNAIAWRLLMLTSTGTLVGRPLLLLLPSIGQAIGADQNGKKISEKQR